MKTISLLEGIGLGALLMYLFDPERGNGRRSVLRDKTTRFAREKREAFDVMSRDLANRTKGVVHLASNRIANDHPSDVVLLERVKSAVGRMAPECKDIEVQASNGHLTLSGCVPRTQHRNLLNAVRGVRGVSMINDQLDIDEAGVGEPTGQGAVNTDNWTPAASMLTAIGGSLLTLYGISRRGPIGGIFALAGMGLIAKGFNDTETRMQRGNQDRQDQGQRQQDQNLVQPTGGEKVTEGTSLNLAQNRGADMR